MSLWRGKIHTCKYFCKDGVMCPLGPSGWWRQTAWLSSRLCHFLAWRKLGMTTIAPSLLVYYEDRMWTVQTNVLAQFLAHISGHLINISPDYYDWFPFLMGRISPAQFQKVHWTVCLRLTISHRWAQVKTVVSVSCCNTLKMTQCPECKQRMEALPVGKYYIRHFPRMRYHGHDHVNTDHWHANTPWKYLWWNFSTNPNSLRRVKRNHKLFPRTL